MAFGRSRSRGGYTQDEWDGWNAAKAGRRAPTASASPGYKKGYKAFQKQSGSSSRSRSTSTRSRSRSRR